MFDWEDPQLLSSTYGNCPQVSKVRRGIDELFCEVQCLLYKNCPRNKIIFLRQLGR